MLEELNTRAALEIRTPLEALAVFGTVFPGQGFKMWPAWRGFGVLVCSVLNSGAI